MHIKIKNNFFQREKPLQLENRGHDLTFLVCSQIFKFVNDNQLAPF